MDSGAPLSLVVSDKRLKKYIDAKEVNKEELKVKEALPQQKMVEKEDIERVLEGAVQKERKNLRKR